MFNLIHITWVKFSKEYIEFVEGYSYISYIIRCRIKFPNTIMACFDEWSFIESLQKVFNTSYLFWEIYSTFQEIYCFISNLVLPFLHISPVHPAWHPPIHWPDTLSHLPESLQFMLQFFAQSYPYCPFEHSSKDQYTCLFKKDIIIINFFENETRK